MVYYLLGYFLVIEDVPNFIFQHSLIDGIVNFNIDNDVLLFHFLIRVKTNEGTQPEITNVNSGIS